MTERRKLPDRRYCETQTFTHLSGDKPFQYVVTIGYFDDRAPGEIFVNTEMKSGSEADTAISDAAVAVSLALQYGCPLDTLRAAMKRTPTGAPMGPLAHALDVVAVRHLQLMEEGK